MKKGTFRRLLVAEMHRALRLAAMQYEIEEGHFDVAMEHHFEYLYWNDEWTALYPKHTREYWDFKARARGDT